LSVQPTIEPSQGFSDGLLYKECIFCAVKHWLTWQF